MNQKKQNILIVETKDGAKYQGIYVSKDIQKQTITLSNVKKTFQGKEEPLSLIEIFIILMKFQKTKKML